MKSTKKEDNFEVKNNEIEKEAVETGAVEKAATVTAEAASEKEEHKDKKKKKYTVDELLSQEGRIDLYDEYGRKKKIKVKVKTGKLKKKEARFGYLFTAPYIIGVCVFLLYPLIMSVVYTFHNVYYHANGSKIMDFKGFYYYQRIFEKETDLLMNLGTLAIKLLMAVPLIVVFSLIISMLLNMKIKGKGIFRTIFFLPVIIVSGPVMTQITGETSSIQAVDLSLIEQVLTSVLPMWLASGISFIFENILLMLWYSGVQILIFLAALQKIDTSLYEAAKIDGGSSWECFWKITLPTIKPMLLLNALYTVVFLSQEALISPIISRISEVMQANNEGYGYTSTYSLMYSIIILLFVGVVALAFKPKKDAYEKQIRKTKKLEKKTRRKLAKHQKQLIKNEIKLQKAIEKEKKMKAAGKDLKGGNFDE